jgi:type VI secretion system protein VasD
MTFILPMRAPRLTIIAALIAAGCGKTPPPAAPTPAAPAPAPPPITIAAPVEAKVKAVMTITAGVDANPDATGRPSPIVVRVYQLKTDASFNGAEFFALFDDDQKVLGAELISRDEFVMTPSERRTIDVVVSDQARFVGAIAAYRDIRNSQWRALAAAAPHKGLNIDVGRARVSLSLAD